MNDISHILMQSIGNGDFPCPLTLTNKSVVS